MSTFRTRKTAACPSCCPDGGACFTIHGSENWKCNNCGHLLPKRTYKPAPKTTNSQQQVLDKLTRAGWSLEVKFIGRNVWVTGRKDRGNSNLNLFNGDTFHGTIGVRGTFKLTLQRFGGDAVITDDIGIEVYLK